jgi:ribosomal protein S18 acetylase RimI-like enzyme
MSEAAWGVEHGALWALDLPAAAVPPEPPAGISYRLAGDADTVALAAAMAVPESEVLSRTVRGCRAMAAWDRDEVACYGWISTRREHVGELGIDFVLPDGESYIWDCGTVVRQRGRGLYRVLLGEMARTLGAEGQRRVWIGATTTNEASNHTFAAVGFQPAVSVVAVRVAGRGLLFRRRAAPGADPALVADAWRVVLGRG